MNSLLEKTWFVLQAVSADTAQPIFEQKLITSDFAAVCQSLDLDVRAYDDMQSEYELGLANLIALSRIFEIDEVFFSLRTTLQKWSKNRNIPYLIHTNIEHFLMIEKRKPLAVFIDLLPSDFLEDMHVLFCEQVTVGQFIAAVKDDRLERIKDGKFDVKIRRTLLYAVSSEAWRIDAYLFLAARADRRGWSAEFECLQGFLLGYTEEEAAWWTKHRGYNRRRTAPD